MPGPGKRPVAVVIVLDALLRGFVTPRLAVSTAPSPGKSASRGRCSGEVADVSVDADGGLFVGDSADPVDSLKNGGELMDRLYWQEKDLRRCTEVGWAAIDFGLAAAHEAGDESGREYLAAVKSLAYNVGSYAWPGWAEPDIVIGPVELEKGRRAAELNLRLAVELKRGPLPLSRAHWLAGAYHLVARDYAVARESFDRAAESALEARSESDRLLNIAYSRLARILSSPGHEGARQELAEAQARLRQVEGGDGLAKQIETAAAALAQW